jgi:hypothetical protein
VEGSTPTGREEASSAPRTVKIIGSCVLNIRPIISEIDRKPATIRAPSVQIGGSDTGAWDLRVNCAGVGIRVCGTGPRDRPVSYAFRTEEALLEMEPTRVCALLVGLPDVTVVRVGEHPCWLRIAIVTVLGPSSLR